MNKHILKTGLIFLLSFTGVTSASETEFQSHEEINKAVIRFVQDKIQAQDNIQTIIEVDSLDSRLRLAKCESPIQVFMAQNSRITSRFSVGVRCDSNKPWQLYVPVVVSKMANIYVANSVLNKGDIVGEDDLKLIKTDINQLHTRPIFQADEILGMVAKRNISMGSPFSERLLKLPTIIKRGDAVDIVASTSGLSIRMTGEAMGSGAYGQRIKVKNSSSKKTVEATVIDAHTVQINL